MYNWKPPASTIAPSIPRRVRRGLAVFASLAIGLAGTAPGTYAAPIPAQPLTPPPVRLISPDAQRAINTTPVNKPVQNVLPGNDRLCATCRGVINQNVNPPPPPPPQPYNVPAFASMSVTLPQADGTDNTQIADQTTGNYVKVPWTDAEFQFPIAYNDSGSGFDPDQAAFYVGMELCLTPDQAAGYTGEFYGEFLGSPGDGCAQPPTCLIIGCGNWYTVMANSGSIVRPYATSGVLVGPDNNNSLNHYPQALAGGTAKDTLTFHWNLPYRFNTMRFDLITDTAGGTGPAHDQATIGPVTVEVIPAALMQLNVLPYTILYAAAGDKSSATYTGSTSFATSMSVGSGTQLDNTWSEKSAVDAGSNITFSVGPFGFDFGGDNTWDHNTTSGTGVATSSSTSFQQSNKKTFFLGSPQVGDQGTYNAEPFWSDEIVLQLHPQLAVWDFQGKPKVQLVGALGDPAFPSFARPTVRQLDECATGKPMIPPEQVLADNGISLSADECSALLSLDPFYPSGQRFGGTDPHRTQQITEQEYGLVHGPYGLGQEHESSVQIQQERTSTYSATVQDIRSNSATQGVTFTIKTPDGGSSGDGGSGKPAIDLGLSGKISNTQSGGSTYSTQMQISYKQSNSATDSQAITVDGVLSDDKGDFDVHIYYDNQFGTYMYVYLNAPCKNFAACPGTVQIANPNVTQAGHLGLGVGPSAGATTGAGTVKPPDRVTPIHPIVPRVP